MRIRNLILIVPVLLAGCDTAPGPSDSSGQAPVVSDLSYTPGSFLLDNIPPSQIDGEVARVSITVTVSVQDADGDTGPVSVIVRSPIPARDAVGNAELPASGGGLYSGTVQLAIPTADVGNYTIAVTAVDSGARLSNEVQGTLAFDATGNPPVIEEVDVPATVVRPAPGEPAIAVQLRVRVSDLDGLANVLRVDVVVNDAATLHLCDDGGNSLCNAGFGSSGDETAGDGWFTLTIQVESTNAAGENDFQFTAYDRAGLSSESINRTIVLE